VGQEIFLFPKMSKPALGLKLPLVQSAAGIFPGDEAAGVTLTTHLHLVPKLRMCGAIPLLTLYAFMAWSGTTTFNFTPHSFKVRYSITHKDNVALPTPGKRLNQNLSSHLK
jgi:hypothetical protein